ncbi:Fpg/Nei family DNA glycosylase [Methanobacterium sp. ACI-7]|uniref:Fpg/Nei family DNA glycosylase n=1 Tax=unclassified Methanobacterium TaxID=2627676 RepID=UPI0039C0DB4A
MPELPEVESFKRYIEKTSMHKKIENIEVNSPQQLQNIEVEDLREKLEKKTFQHAERRGKYLFLNLDNDYWLVLHFGMTGRPKYFKDDSGLAYYDRINFKFEDKSKLTFEDPRKFGKIYLTANMEDFIKQKRLGPDALGIDLKTFKGLFSKRRGSSKSALMNQHVIAGIGNIYSDEILYHVGVHPKTPLYMLDDGKIENIFIIMKEVLNLAIDVQLQNKGLPNSYIIPHRKKKGKCPNSDTELKTIKISGRTSYYCPDCQKELF